MSSRHESTLTSPQRVMAGPSLSSFPVELIHEVLFHVELPSDVLSFALTCALFRDVALPDCLEHRVIKGSVYHTELWNHLLSRPDLARHVRILDICDKPLSCRTDSASWVLPGALKGSPDGVRLGLPSKETFTSVCRAIEHVRRIRFSQYDTGIRKVYPWPKPDFLSILCSELREVHIIHVDTCSLRGYPLHSRHTFWKLQGITSLKLRANIEVHAEAWSALRTMLLASPSLKEFYAPRFVGSAGRGITSAFAQMRLPALKHIKIGWDKGAASDIVTFLNAHPSIQTFIWDQSYWYFDPSDVTPFIRLPSLRRLEGCHPDILRATLRNQLRGCIRLDHIDGVPVTDEFLPYLHAIDPSTLTTIGLSEIQDISTLAQLAALFPFLTELRLRAMGTKEASSTTSRWKSFVKRAGRGGLSHNRWVVDIDDVVPLFPNLEVVGYVGYSLVKKFSDWYVMRRDSPSDADEGLRWVREKYPRLRVVNGMSMHT